MGNRRGSPYPRVFQDSKEHGTGRQFGFSTKQSADDLQVRLKSVCRRGTRMTGGVLARSRACLLQIFCFPY